MGWGDEGADRRARPPDEIVITSRGAIHRYLPGAWVSEVTASGEG
jgi:hypothetical protein